MPTVEDIAQRFGNLTVQQTEVPEPSVHPECTALLQWSINQRIEKKLQKERTEVAMTNLMERAVNQPQREPDVKVLSLGFGDGSRSSISKEDVEKIKKYEETHVSLHGIPDVMEMQRLELYV